MIMIVEVVAEVVGEWLYQWQRQYERLNKPGYKARWRAEVITIDTRSTEVGGNKSNI